MGLEFWKGLSQFAENKSDESDNEFLDYPDPLRISSPMITNSLIIYHKLYWKSRVFEDKRGN